MTLAPSPTPNHSAARPRRTLFNRIPWLLTWSLWAWLGFGLYRELPRNPDSIACRLPLGEREILAGLIDQPPLAVTIAKFDDDRIFVRVWDIESGTETCRFTGPSWPGALDNLPYLLAADHRILVVSNRFDGPVGTEYEYMAIDLVNGASRLLGVAAQGSRVLHPEQPWALFVGAGQFCPRAAWVVDLRTGRHIFAWPPANTAIKRHALNAVFFVGRDRVAISTWDGEDDSLTPVVEVWNIGDAREPAAVFRNLSLGAHGAFTMPSSTTPTGRVAWRPDEWEPSEFKVFDFDHGRLLFDNSVDRPGMGRFGFRRQPEPLLLDAAGAACLSVCQDAECWNLEKRTLFWQPLRTDPSANVMRVFPDMAYDSMRPIAAQRYDYVESVQPTGRFSVHEIWAARFNNWKRSVMTHAVRDAWSGAVVYRTSEPEPDARRYLSQQRLSPAGSWSADEHGVVRRLPPPPNYPLLALCQTILALPLILLGAALRWRRIRRLRLANPAP